MFKDEAIIDVQAGKGGDGIVAFRREKFVPRGGPAGGDGGQGGAVVLVVDPSLNSLDKLSALPLVRAENGRNGLGSNKTGASGQDQVLRVPQGTLVYDAQEGNLFKDLAGPEDRLVVAKGGRGGKGNGGLATATDRAPRRATLGQPGERRRLRLELKLIADVGLVGLPNAGKSTLLSRLTKARPKVADYPFTTLNPALGVVELSLDQTFILADLPGLIAGAHQGQGLGDRFLRHIERTSYLLHLVDCSSQAEDPVADWQVIRDELASYSQILAQRPSIVAATKLDDPAAVAQARRLEDALGEPVVGISAVTGHNLPLLLEKISNLLFT